MYTLDSRGRSGESWNLAGDKSKLSSNHCNHCNWKPEEVRISGPNKTIGGVKNSLCK